MRFFSLIRTIFRNGSRILSIASIILKTSNTKLLYSKKIDNLHSILLLINRYLIECSLEGVVSQILEEHWHPTQSLNNVLPYLSYENAVKLGRFHNSYLFNKFKNWGG